MEHADMAIEYQRVRIGAADALLPKSSEVTTTLRRTKTRQRNRITFSGCRQYGSESVISFLAPEEKPPAAEGATPARDGPDVVLPARARLVLRLAAALDSAKTPVGTQIQATLDEDVTDGVRVLMPKGARVSGRVRTLTRAARTGPACEIGLEFTRAEWDGGRAHFAAGLEEVEPDSGAQLTLSSFVDDTLEPSPIGTFYVRGKAFTLKPGFRMVWTVLPAAPPLR